MPFYRFHFYDGQSPVQMWAPTRQDAESAVRSLRGANFTYAGEGNEPISGYQTVASGGTGGQQPGGGNPAAGVTVGQGGAGATGPGGVTGGLENVFPQAAYERGLQRQGQNPEGFLSNYLEGLYRPAAATFGIQSALGPAPTGDLDNEFQNYVARTPVGSIRGQATEAFRSLGRPAAAATADQQATLAGYANPYGAGPNGEADSDKIQNLIALAGQAAQTRYSPFAARQLLPSGATAKSRYERGGLQGSLYDFLKKQYGLTGGF